MIWIQRILPQNKAENSEEKDWIAYVPVQGPEGDCQALSLPPASSTRGRVESLSCKSVQSVYKLADQGKLPADAPLT